MLNENNETNELINVSGDSINDNGFDLDETKDLESEEIVDLKRPFDPKKIDIQVQQTTMDVLIKRLINNEIDLNPDFQRSPDLWKKEIQSRLIESLLIKLPIPAFYFDASNDDKWQVIDGLQRLSAIKHFVVENSLHLKDLEYLKECNDKTFSELPRMFERRIYEAPVTLYLIKPGTPVEVKYSLFYRINTGGLKLNPQEIRHALSQSINKAQASKYLKKLSELNIFQTCVRASDRRMLDKELILRFIAFRFHKYVDYKEPMFIFLNENMEELGEVSSETLDNLEKEFTHSVELAWQIFKKNAFRKSILKDHSKGGVINRALFEVITVTFSILSKSEKDNLKKRKVTFIYLFKELLKDTDFFESISISTTYAKNIKFRFDKFQTLINQVLNRGGIEND